MNRPESRAAREEVNLRERVQVGMQRRAGAWLTVNGGGNRPHTRFLLQERSCLDWGSFGLREYRHGVRVGPCHTGGLAWKGVPSPPWLLLTLVAFYRQGTVAQMQGHLCKVQYIRTAAVLACQLQGPQVLGRTPPEGKAVLKCAPTNRGGVISRLGCQANHFHPRGSEGPSLLPTSPP